MNGRAIRWLLGATGLVLIVIASVLAVQQVPGGGDTSCGTVFYDTAGADAGFVCAHPLGVQRTWTSSFAIAGLLLLVVPAVVVAVRSHNPARLVAIVWALMAFGFMLVGTNRLLQPYEGTHSCGSVVNRVHTYVPEWEQFCDRKLAPQRRAAIWSFGAAVVIGAGAVVIDRRRGGSGGQPAGSLLRPSVAHHDAVSASPSTLPRG